MSPEERARQIVAEQLGAGARVSPLGGGFYGRAFLAESGAERVVVKVALYPDLARREARALRTLARYGRVKVPEVLFEDDFAIGMEYVPGVNAGFLERIDEENRARVAREMVDALTAWHDVRHPEGFGELDAETFVPDFRDFYFPIAATVHEKALALCDTEVMRAFDRSMERYWDIFALPIRDARLVHGDFNAWNVMLSEDLSHVRAVIDPFNCRWSDAEFDLYQLDNANGKMY